MLQASEKIHAGIVQGGVLSPTLFNLYMADFTEPPEGIKVIIYADDVTIYTSAPDPEDLVDRLNRYIETVCNYFQSLNLTISEDKSTVTLFTPQSAQANKHPQVLVQGNILKLAKTPKLLGVTLDTILCFGPHTRDIAANAQKINALLKALAGTAWGSGRETLMTLHKATSRSVINYCCSTWAPIIKDCHWKRLQLAQNKALRITTGCYNMTNIDDLHNEARVLPIKEHTHMLAKQYAITCYNPRNPCHSLTTRPFPHRPQMKPDLFYKYENQLPNQRIEEKEAKRLQKVLHTQTVNEVSSSLRPNPVYRSAPPEIHETESSLPRVCRTRLAQLRNGYCRILNSYVKNRRKN